MIQALPYTKEVPMEYSQYFFQSSSGLGRIHVNQWVPTDLPVRGVIQISHGVAEYGYRYHDFAEFLCNHGFAVLANDHIGHGQSVYPSGADVYFGEHNGWWCVVEDMETIRQQVRKSFPGLPVILFGHSMGSFLSRTHMILHPGCFEGCILSGTGYPGIGTIKAGKVISKLRMLSLGSDGYSPLVDRMAFGSYNHKFSPNRTHVDWLSANEENVDNYIADPLCGQPAKLGLFSDLMDGLTYITSFKNIQNMDRTTPILLLSGAQDPVGDMGKGVVKTEKQFKASGIQDVSMKLYPGLRHEILNETCHLEIYQDILTWLESRYF